MPGIGAAGDHRLERVGVDRDFAVERRAFVGGKLASSARRRHPSPRPSERMRRPCEILERVSSGAIMPARAPPSIDMLQTVMRSSMSSARMAEPVYSKTLPVPPPMPICAISARMMSFAVTPGLQRAVDADSEGLRRALQQALRGQHVLHFAGADAERQRAERAVRGGVAVAADHGHAGLRQPSSGPMTCTMP